jgi:hypothetical protein
MSSGRRRLSEATKKRWAERRRTPSPIVGSFTLVLKFTRNDFLNEEIIMPTKQSTSLGVEADNETVAGKSSE